MSSDPEVTRIKVVRRKKNKKTENEIMSKEEGKEQEVEITTEKQSFRSKENRFKNDRNFAFTYFHEDMNNDKFVVGTEYHQEFVDWFIDYVKEKLNYRYLIFQQERCPKTTRVHFQGTIVFDNRRSIKNAKKILNNCHIEACENVFASIEYCRKDESREGGPWEDGEAPEQGKRNDLISLRDKIMEGKTEYDIMMDNTLAATYARYSRFADKCIEMKMKKFSNALRKVQVEVIWGASGVGKTFRVYEENGYDKVYRVQCINDKVWFDGYGGEDVIILDDFYGWVKWDYFLGLLDVYPCRLDVKGKSAWACWTKVYITSNVHPKQWYPNKLLNGELRDEFVRRIHKVTWINEEEICDCEPTDKSSTLEDESVVDPEVCRRNTRGLHTSYKRINQEHITSMRQQLKLGEPKNEETRDGDLFGWAK